MTSANHTAIAPTDPRLVRTEVTTEPSHWRSLEELFQTGSGYLPQSFDAGLDAVSEAVAEAALGEGSWSSRISVGVTALLAFFDEHSDWAQLLALEAPVSAATTGKCSERVQEALSPVLEQAREDVIIGAQINPSGALIAELIVLGSLSLIRARMLRADGRALTELSPALISQVIDPYLKSAVARLDRHSKPAPVSHRAEMVPIRPHPRTVLALRTIASAPGLSSGQVGRAVGIDNSGHMSGLLRRLQRRGLVENASSRQSGSGQLAWFLTPYGQRVLEILTSSFSSARWTEEFEQVKASA